MKFTKDHSAMKQRTRLLCIISLCALFLLSCKKETFSELDALQGTWKGVYDNVIVVDDNKYVITTSSFETIFSIQNCEAKQQASNQIQIDLTLKKRGGWKRNRPQMITVYVSETKDTLFTSNGQYYKL